MRTATVNGRTGIIAAVGMTAFTAGKVFVLFDDDDSAESSAGWFHAHAVLPTSVVPVTF